MGGGQSSQTVGQDVFLHHHDAAQKAQYKESRSLWSWAADVVNFFWPNANDSYPARSKEWAFMAFYLSQSANFSLSYLTLNILLLLASIFIISQIGLVPHEQQTDDLFRSFAPAVVDIFIWIILSCACLIYFVVYSYYQRKDVRWCNSSACEVWYEVGAGILLTRIIILATQITHLLQSGGECLDTPDVIGTGDTGFGIMFIKMTMDTYQTYVMAMLPFPQPWALCLVLIELFRQVLRLKTCAYRISDLVALQWISNLGLTMLFYSYLIMIACPSIYLEGSFRNRFRSEQLQRETDQNKREMVGFLSRDVRVPLQYMLHALASIDLVTIAGNNVQPLLNDIHRYSGIVNAVADELLLVVRIKEGRYTSKMTPVSDVCVLMDEAVSAFKQRRQFQQEGRTGEKRSARGGQQERPEVTEPLSVEVTSTAGAIDVDEMCLLAILRYLLVYLAAAKSTIRLNAVVVKAPQSDPAALPSNSRGVGELTLTAAGGQAPRRGDQAGKLKEATTCFVCATIAAACGGTFASTRSGVLTLTLPCQYRTTANCSADRLPLQSLSSWSNDADGAESVGAGSFATNMFSAGDGQSGKAQRDTLRHEQEELEIKVRSSTEMQEAVRRKKVCAIVADPVLESVITRAIERMGLGVGMTVLHELPHGHQVPVAMMTFTTAFETCAELRQRGYQGVVVLFSGSASYLDDAQLAQVDFCLPLPSSDRHMGQFIDWLVQRHEKGHSGKLNEPQEAPGLQRRPSVQLQKYGAPEEKPKPKITKAAPSALSELLAYTTLADLELDALWQGVHTVGAALTAVPTRLARAIRYCGDCFVSQDTWFFVKRLPPGTAETYIQWKLLNPSGSWHHKSCELVFVVGTRLLIALFVETLVFKNTIGATASALFSSSLLLFRKHIHRYIFQPCGVRLWQYWVMVFLSSWLFYVSFILQDDSRSPPEKMTLAQFMVAKFGVSTGAQQLYGMIMSATCQRAYSIYWAHPLNLLQVFTIFVRCSQAVWAVMRNISSEQWAQFLQMVYVQISVLNIAYFTHMENTYRREFIATYEHTLAKAFLEQCLEICQQDMRGPLEFLLGRMDDIMLVLHRAALTRDFVLDATAVSRLEPLHQSHLLLAEIAKEFSYSRLLQPSEEASVPVRQQMEPVQLCRKVAELIGAFTSRNAEYNVSIEAEVDVVLTVIRVDWPMLSAILTNLISASLRALRDECIETPRKEGLKSEVFIKIVAVPSAEKGVPFVAPRLMLINVCDSSSRGARLSKTNSDKNNTDASTSAAEKGGREGGDQNMFEYGRSMCAQLVRKVVDGPAVFQTIHSPDSRLQTVQRFTFPYQLSSQTRRAAEYLHEETPLPYITVRAEPARYLAAYERILVPEGRTHRNRHGMLLREPGKKIVVMVTCVDPAAKAETMKVMDRLKANGWDCLLKYVLRIPTLRSIGTADCVIVDQQLQIQENVSISEVVLKLRVCGYSGVIAVVLLEGHPTTASVQEELAHSAAEVDLVMYAPITAQRVMALTAAMERKCVRQVLTTCSA